MYLPCKRHSKTPAITTRVLKFYANNALIKTIIGGMSARATKWAAKQDSKNQIIGEEYHPDDPCTYVPRVRVCANVPEIEKLELIHLARSMLFAWTFAALFQRFVLASSHIAHA